MTDYRREEPLASELSPMDPDSIGPAADLLAEPESFEPGGKVEQTLDNIEARAAQALGPDKASRLRAGADVAVERGQTLYERSRDLLDEQLAVAPYRTVGMAAFAGLVAGLLLTPHRKKVYLRET